MNAVTILEDPKLPEWFTRDAKNRGVSVDLRSHRTDTKELFPAVFISFFTKMENYEGRNVSGWNWTVRRVDGLVNLFVWKNK